MVMNSTVSYCMVLYGTVCYCMVLHGTVWYCKVLYAMVMERYRNGMVWYVNTMQLQCNAMQCNTLQCNAKYVCNLRMVCVCLHTCNVI
jgi:hypothetical protein